MEDILTLDETTKAGSDLIGQVSLHPAILRDEVKKKESTGTELMDVDYGDQLDQIEHANKLVADIDHIIKELHNSVKDKYTQRFPELKVADPMQYIMTVQLLGNKPSRISDESIKSQLIEVLDTKVHLMVTMTASTTQGIKIEPEVMDKIQRACAVAIQLANLRSKLLTFVEKNMATIAPNLSVILGASIAAKLMGLAGGLMNLATMPSCNVLMLGSHRQSNIEKDINAPARVGHIYECDLIQQIPFDHTKDVRKRAVKWVANKCVLAARCDFSKSDALGGAGRQFREKIELMINKELEPPPKKAARPLPAPIDKSGKKRGGKRVRRMKERYGQTELRRAANRMTFGDVGDDAYQNDLGLGKSQLNAIQKLRGPQINEKTKIKLSKAAQKKLAKNQAAAANNNSNNNGKQDDNNNKRLTNSTQNERSQASMSLTLKPDQHQLEIFNPKAKEPGGASGTSGESNNYFSNLNGFFAVKKDEAKQ